MRSMNENLLFVFNNGETLYLHYKDKQLYVLPVKKDFEHDDPVTSVDISENLRLQVTVDKDGLIKVWNEMRELVREIKFYDEVSSVAFMSGSSDLLVGHGGKLSKISAKDYINPKDIMCDPTALKEMYSTAFELTDRYIISKSTETT